MRRAKLFAGFPSLTPPHPRDGMLNEKLRATRAVCYHSICLRLQTGHYPAIIFPDLPSPAEEAIAAARSPPSAGRMGTSLKICIYMIRLSSLLDLDIYFPLKMMFDYTLIKNRKSTKLAGTN